MDPLLAVPSVTAAWILASPIWPARSGASPAEKNSGRPLSGSTKFAIKAIGLLRQLVFGECSAVAGSVQLECLKEEAPIDAPVRRQRSGKAVKILGVWSRGRMSAMRDFVGSTPFGCDNDFVQRIAWPHHRMAKTEGGAGELDRHVRELLIPFRIV